MSDSRLRRPLSLSALALLLFLAGGGYLLHLEREGWIDERRQEARGELYRYVSVIERQVSRSLAAVESMESYLRHHEGEVEDFETHSADLLRGVGAISGLLLSPEGVVRHVYPVSGYRPMLGQRVVESRYAAATAHQAMVDGRVALSPPLTLDNGQSAVIGHKPIYQLDREGDPLFWGFASVVLELRDLVRDAGLDRLDVERYRYQLVIDGEAVAGDPLAFVPGQQVVADVAVPDGRWELRFAPLQAWDAPPRFYVNILLALLASLLFAYLVFVLLWQPVVLRRQVARADAELKRANARYASVFNTVREVLFQLDERGQLKMINPAWRRLTGYETVDSLGRALEDFVHPEDQLLFQQLLREALEGRVAGSDIELRLLGRGNQVVWVEMALQVNRDKPDSAGVVAGTLHDVTERKKADRVIQYQANYDTLTNLPNRKLFQDRFGRAIENALRKGVRMALLFIDLDRFKWINDTLGHAAGDRLLKEVAMRLTSCVRKADTVARFGGDEFIVLLAEINSHVDAEIVARKILAELARPFQLEGHREAISGSVGITVCPDDGRDLATLMKNADKVMYHVKEGGRNDFKFFTEKMNLDLQLRRDPVGVEALLRWQDPEHGTISPGETVSIAEDTQLIEELSRWTLDRACDAYRRLREVDPRLDYVCVNVSSKQFRARIVDLLRETIDRHRLEPGMLAIDLTEALIVEDREEIWEEIERIRSLGVRVMLDDFGTGVSSLGHLKRLSPDAVKLQSGYLAHIVPETSAAAMLGALIAMAHSLDIQVVGEGVEEPRQAEMLEVLGCDFAQGYVFSPPLGLDELVAALRRGGLFDSVAAG
ncbi:MAG: EAL domain-containing protein [Gammaproteobacteria bacterium]|nr:EAL domain-containing protein [Gammaproteobacteria bacterium]